MVSRSSAPCWKRLAAHALRGLVLQLELRGQIGVGGHLGRRGAVAFQPRAHAVVGQLRAVAHQRAIGLAVGAVARRRPRELDHHRGAVFVLVERRDAFGELRGQHGKDLDAGVHRGGLALRVAVDAPCPWRRARPRRPRPPARECGRRATARPTRSGRDLSRCRCRWTTRAGCAGPATPLAGGQRRTAPRMAASSWSVPAGKSGWKPCSIMAACAAATRLKCTGWSWLGWIVSSGELAAWLIGVIGWLQRWNSCGNALLSEEPAYHVSAISDERKRVARPSLGRAGPLRHLGSDRTVVTTSIY